jgi:hypothetical protein
VFIEIDTPGHTATIAPSYPEHVACFEARPFEHFVSGFGFWRPCVSFLGPHSFPRTLMARFPFMSTQHLARYLPDRIARSSRSPRIDFRGITTMTPRYTPASFHPPGALSSSPLSHSTVLKVHPTSNIHMSPPLLVFLLTPTTH